MGYSVAIEGKHTGVVTPESADADVRCATLDRWYRREVKAALSALLETWQPAVGTERGRTSRDLCDAAPRPGSG